MLATLTVNVFHDNVDGLDEPIRNDGDLTLRDAIAYVNREFDPGPLDIQSNGIVHIDLTEDFGTNDTILFDPEDINGGHKRDRSNIGRIGNMIAEKQEMQLAMSYLDGRG